MDTERREARQTRIARIRFALNESSGRFPAISLPGILAEHSIPERNGKVTIQVENR